MIKYKPVSILKILANIVSVTVTVYMLFVSFELAASLLGWSRILHQPMLNQPGHWYMTFLYMSGVTLSIALQVVSIILSIYFGLAINCLVILNLLRVISGGRDYFESYWVVALTMITLVTGFFASLFFTYPLAAFIALYYSIKHYRALPNQGLKYRRHWILVIFFVPLFGGLACLIKFRKNLKHLFVPKTSRNRIDGIPERAIGVN